jgi:hypothetical protein
VKFSLRTQVVTPNKISRCNKLHMTTTCSHDVGRQNNINKNKTSFCDQPNARSGEVPNLKTEDVITCWLIRSVTHPRVQRQMSMEQWWTGD